MDSFAANGAFAKQIGVTFPLLSDFKRDVSKKYGILDENRLVATRATFVLNKDGIIQHIKQGSTAIDPTGAYQACSIINKKP